MHFSLIKIAYNNFFNAKSHSFIYLPVNENCRLDSFMGRTVKPSPSSSKLGLKSSHVSTNSDSKAESAPHRSQLISLDFSAMGFSVHFLFFNNKNIGIRKLSTASRAENPSEFSISGESAYEVLGVSESSSFAEIKASFRKLAKETHPDVSRSSHRFLQILAAYEVSE